MRLGRSVHGALIVALGLTASSSPPAAAEDRGQRRPAPAASGALRIDDLAFEMSASTGGDFYFWAPGEFASTPTLAIPLESEPIVLTAGRLDATGSEATIEVPVDASVGSLTIFAGVQGRERIEVLDPDGSSALSFDQRARVQQTRYMLIVTVPAPQPGLWQIVVAGSGRYMVNARAGRGRGDGAPELVELLDFDFVELRGRPGHEGYFPLDAPPAAGAAAMCSVTLSGAVSEVRFRFIDGAGETIAELDLERGSPEVAADEWLGACAVPEVSYRLAAVGTNPAGGRLQRVAGPLRDPHLRPMSREEIDRLLRAASGK